MIKIKRTHNPIEDCRVVLPSDPGLAADLDARRELLENPGRHEELAIASPDEVLTWWTIRALKGPQRHKVDARAYAGVDLTDDSAGVQRYYRERYEAGLEGVVQAENVFKEGDKVKGVELRELLRRPEMCPAVEQLGAMVLQITNGDPESVEGK